MFQARGDAEKARRPFRIGYSVPRFRARAPCRHSIQWCCTKPVASGTGASFIDFMLEGQNSAELAHLIGSGNPNQASMRYIDQIIADNRAVFPDASAMRRLEMLLDLDQKQHRVLNRIWTEIKLR